MKYLVVIMLSVASLFGGSYGCNKDHSAVAGNTNTYDKGSNPTDYRWLFSILGDRDIREGLNRSGIVRSSFPWLNQLR